MSDGETMTCKEVYVRLWEYIDGELPPERTETMRDHLEKCGCCDPEYDFQRAYRTFLRRQSERSAPPGLRRRVLQRLRDEEGCGGD